MGTFRDVTKQYPCPICGKTDWCSFLQPDTAAYPGQVLCVCRRIQASEITSSINGKTYYSIKELSDGSILYTDVKKDSEKENPVKGYVYTPLKPSVKPEDISNPPLPNEELDKISHRTYSTGFYFGTPQNAQTYENAGYIRDYSVAAIVDGYEDGFIIATVKNKFLKGQIFDCLEPGNAPFMVSGETFFDENGILIESAPHPMMKVKIPFDRPIKKGALLRMKAD